LIDSLAQRQTRNLPGTEFHCEGTLKAATYAVRVIALYHSLVGPRIVRIPNDFNRHGRVFVISPIAMAIVATAKIFPPL
jgi:hypothetical protein